MAKLDPKPSASAESPMVPQHTLDSLNTGPSQSPELAIDGSVGNNATFAYLLPPQPPDELGRLGCYRILGVLGQGGMGTVFRAEDPRLKRKVALKTMQPQFAANVQAKRRFLREAAAQAAVEHDHIIPIYQVGEDNGVPFIAMPLLKGQTLGDALKANPLPPFTEVLRIGRETADGLAAAHDVGLMHRDIKPASIWLEGQRR